MYGFQGKGSWQRPTSVSTEEKDLRWELMSSKTTPERKEEIKVILDGLRKSEENGKGKSGNS